MHPRALYARSHLLSVLSIDALNDVISCLIVILVGWILGLLLTALLLLLTFLFNLKEYDAAAVFKDAQFVLQRGNGAVCLVHLQQPMLFRVFGPLGHGSRQLATKCVNLWGG